MKKILIIAIISLFLVGSVTAWVYKEDFSDTVRRWKTFPGLDSAVIYYDKVTEGKGKDKEHIIYYKVELRENKTMQDFMVEIIPYQEQLS